MKTIKIDFVDFFGGFDKQNNDFYKLLSEKYKVEISETPDYIFYSCFGYQHLKYNCIRIFYTGECVTPDFNECDYAIGFDRLQFGDRYIRVPLYQIFQYRNNFLSLFDRKPFTMEQLREKKGFCSFVYSNCFAQDKRTEMFEKLSLYKKVDSGGRYLNNIGGAVKDKMIFQSQYKFSIAFENTSYSGYSTEKLMEAFAAGTIPIYYGDPEIGNDFNEKAFINCNVYESLDAVVERIKEIDKDDELYLTIRNESPFTEGFQEADLKDFLYHIFDADISNAFRRPRSITSTAQEKMKLRHSFFENHVFKYYSKVRNQITRLSKNTSLSRKRTK